MRNSNTIFLHLKAVLVSLVLLLSLAVYSSAQGVSVSAQLDSTVIFIGGQIDLKLEATQPEGFKVHFPMLTDTVVNKVEIVKSGAIDTISSSGKQLVMSQTYRITSFDSGLYYIPPIQFEIAEGELLKRVATQPMSLMVVNPFEEVNPEKGITDIKIPMDTPFLLSELYKYLPYILGLFLLAIVLTFAIMYLTKKKTPLQLFTKEKPKLPPHELALSRLDHIKEDKLWQRGLIKEYYSEITDTLRHYIEDRFKIRALEQTTEEIIHSFDGVELNNGQTIKNLQQILSTADLVKFAKHEPLPDENDFSMINALFFVNQTKVEEVKSLEEEKGEKLTKVDEEEKIVVNEPTKS